MDKKGVFTWLIALSIACSFASAAAAQMSPVGMFENHQDVGTVLHPGSTQFDAAKKAYTITGSGTNMWFAQDDFQFAWKKMSGDVSLTAEIAFTTTTGNEHKKAALMIRQTLDSDSVYADIARHGNG
ncbi:MAG TPA: hypothetical protein VLK33_16720, partial [Terriglobales bacterium]|nr:hypothetical protein [Terriglobales bacterium]